MTNDKLPKHIGMIAVGSGLIAALLYLLMINVMLAHIEDASGHVPFDMRPFGYDPIFVETLLEALGVDGRRYYFSRQIALDTFYPAALASTLIATFCWFGRRTPNANAIRIGIVFSIGSALFDYFENLGIATMIWSWPEVSVPLVYAASTATILKSVSTTAAVMLLFWVGMFWIWQSKVVRHSKRDHSRLAL